MRIRLCELDAIEVPSATRFDVDDHRIALIRFADALYAIGDECSHADFSLSAGELEPDDCTIECPKHGALFDVRTGEPESLPAVRPVPVYEVEVDEGVVYVTPQEGESE